MTALHFALILCLLLLTAPGCSLVGGEDDPAYTGPEPVALANASQDSTLLVGTWELRRILVYDRLDGGYVAGPPEAPDQMETLVFTEDVAFEVYRNDSLERRGAYDTWQQLYRESFLRPFAINEDSLVRNNLPVDGAELLYVRAE